MRIEDMERLADALPGVSLRSALTIVRWADQLVPEVEMAVAPPAIPVIMGDASEPPGTVAPAADPAPPAPTEMIRRSPGARLRWPPEVIEEIEGKLARGVRWADIGKQFGCSAHTVRLAVFRRRKAKAAKPAPKVTPEPQKSTPKPTAKPETEPPGPAWLADLSDDFTPQQDLLLAEALKRKVTPADIGKSLGIGINDVARRWLAIVKLATGSDDLPGAAVHADLIDILRARAGQAR